MNTNIALSTCEMDLSGQEIDVSYFVGAAAGLRPRPRSCGAQRRALRRCASIELRCSPKSLRFARGSSAPIGQSHPHHTQLLGLRALRLWHATQRHLFNDTCLNTRIPAGVRELKMATHRLELNKLRNHLLRLLW